MPLTVAWISDYPIEWMPDPPPPLRGLPRKHPETWMSVLLGELMGSADLKIHVLVLRGRVERGFEFERNGVRFHVLKASRSQRLLSLFWVDTLLLRRALRRLQPAVVQAWGNEYAAGLIATRLGYPYLVTIQGLLTWYRETVPVPAYGRFTARVESLCLKRAPLATTESRFAVEYLRRRYPRLAVHQIEHAPQRVFHQVARQPRTQPIRFVTGSPSYRKGSDLLLRALNELRTELPFELVVIGDRNPEVFEPLSGVLAPEFERRLEFKTGLGPAEVARELSAATLMVLPTRADTSPNSVKEAVVAGVPVVASSVGGIPDYVLEGKNGLLLGQTTVPELVQTLRAAVRHPQFGQGVVDPATLARQRDYLSPVLMAERFQEVYHLAAERRPPE